MNTWTELKPGVFHLVYRNWPSRSDLGDNLDRIDRERQGKGLPPCYAIVELDITAHPSHLSWLLERVTGSGPLRHPRWEYPTDGGLLYGPKRAAAWRTLDAKHFGLPERRSVFIVASTTVDPAFIFEQVGGKPFAASMVASNN